MKPAKIKIETEKEKNFDFELLEKLVNEILEEIQKKKKIDKKRRFLHNKLK